MRRAALLLHRTPDGSSHFDWLIERAAGADPDERALIAFRTDVRADEAADRTFNGVRITDHRRLYLDFEGALSDSRGHVQRIASGVVESFDEAPTHLSVLIRWSHHSVKYQGEATGAGDVWRFNAAPVTSR